MKNWLRLLCSFLFLGLAQVAFGLGLGGISAESALNEPLEARIELLNVGSLSEQEIIVEIGSVNDYQVAGVTREYFHTSIEFEPHLAGPNGQSYISLRTTAPVQEPYLNFVLQVRWPQGRLLREYTLLLDLPVFSGRIETAPVSQPSTTPSRPSAATTPASRATTTQAAPIPATPVPPQQTFGGSAAAGSDYRVATGETLWSLAGRVSAGQQMTRHQAMLAIRDLNPEAFSNGDPNTLRAGYVIRIPTDAQANTRTASQAYNEFVSLQQGGNVGSSATPVSAAATDFRNQSSAPAANGGRLTLSSSAALGSGSGNGSDESIQALASENETLKEELDRSELENEDLRERIALLEEQLEVSESLIEIESDELADVQQGLAQNEALSQQAQSQPEPASEPQETAETSETSETSETEPAPEPVPAVPVAATPEPEPGLFSRIMSLAPFIGAVVIVVLLVVMFLMKRRKAAEEDDFLHDDLTDDSQDDQEGDEAGDDDHQTTAFDQTASMQADDSSDDDDNFESMDELFGADKETDEADDEEDQDQPDSEEDEEAPEVASGEDSDEVEDIDLEAALEDLDDFADLDSFASDDIEDFDLESAEGFDETDDEDSLEEPEPESDEQVEEDEEKAEADDDLDGMDFESIDLPDAEEDEEDESSDDDSNSMDFDLGDVDAPEEDEDDESDFSGNEMEFDSEDIELPESDETEDDELDMGNATEFDIGEIDLPDDDQEAEPEAEEPAGNEMEFDIGDIEVPDTEEEADEDDASSDEDDNSLDLDIGDFELPDSDEPEESEEPELDEPEDTGTDESDDDLELPEDEDTTEDMDELLSGLEDEVSGIPEDEDDSDSQDDDMDLGADLDLDDDLLEGLGDADDQSDLAEEMNTKLELADAYIEMGDVRGARELIDEIMSDGNDEQKAEAAKLSDRIDELG